MKSRLILLSVFLALMTVFTANAQRKKVAIVAPANYIGLQAYTQDCHDKFMTAFADYDVTMVTLQ
jgi:hypothetical protein